MPCAFSGAMAMTAASTLMNTCGRCARARHVEWGDEVPSARNVAAVRPRGREPHRDQGALRWGGLQGGPKALDLSHPGPIIAAAGNSKGQDGPERGIEPALYS